jgi:hypothetical protein
LRPSAAILPRTTDWRSRWFLLKDGEVQAEFTSPSAAGSAITGKACNGWAFWNTGAPTAKPAKADKPTGTKRTVHAAPKPAKQATRTRRQKDVPRDGNGQVLPIVEQVDGTFECANCSASFPTRDEAEAHVTKAHVTKAHPGQPVDEPANATEEQPA